MRINSPRPFDFIPTEAIQMRFWSKVQKTDSCWNWLGGADDRGYGVFKVNKKMWRASRLSWFFHHEDPKDLFVCHKCDVPWCVNPDHLFLGTHHDNIVDCWNKGRGTGQCGVASDRHYIENGLLKRHIQS